MVENAGVEKSKDDGTSRRSLFGQVGAGTMGAVALGALAAGGLAASSTPAQAQTVTDVDILNFALNLEYLEAEFYLYAATGQGLQAADRTLPGGGTTRSAQGSVSPGTLVPFRSTAIAGYAQRLAVDEQNHVRFLRAVLGTAAVAEPTLDVGIGPNSAFSKLAVAAGLIVQGQTFNPYADDISFLLGASIFEDVGVTAYAGAARYIGNKDYLEAAAAILAVEAYHAGSIRTLLANIGAGVAFGLIANLRAVLGGGKEQGILIPGLSYNAVAADIESLAFRRTTSEVLNIVYGNTTATPGLFFPNGLNGNIR